MLKRSLLLSVLSTCLSASIAGANDEGWTGSLSLSYAQATVSGSQWEPIERFVTTGLELRLGRNDWPIRALLYRQHSNGSGEANLLEGWIGSVAGSVTGSITETGIGFAWVGERERLSFSLSAGLARVSLTADVIGTVRVGPFSTSLSQTDAAESSGLFWGGRIGHLVGDGVVAGIMVRSVTAGTVSVFGRDHDLTYYYGGFTLGYGW